ncbi:MAG: tetratricopeptide repeat protein [Polyangiales bacterium]
MPLGAEGAPAARSPLADLDLDLPAPKLPKTAPAIPASLPPVKIPPRVAAKLPDLELSDLPAVKAKPAARPALSMSAADDLSDLPAPKIPKPLAPKPEPKLSAPLTPKFEPMPDDELEADIGLPALKGSEPRKDLLKPSEPSFGGPALKKTAPAVLRPVTPKPPSSSTLDIELDLPGLPPPKDVPAKKPIAPTFDGKTGTKPLSPELAKKSEPKPSFEEKPGSGSFDLDLPMTPVATPKKSFAKPSAAKLEPVQKPAPQPSTGSLPKDSLAIDSAPFFANTASLGTFGALDDLGEKPELSDLPAPSDLPALKKPAARTSLGLGGSLPKDSLDLPSGFAQPNAVLPVISGLQSLNGLSPVAQQEPEIDLPAPSDLPALKRPGATPSLPELDLPAPRDLPAVKSTPSLSDLDLPAPRDLPAVKKPAAALKTGSFEVQPLTPAALKPGALALDLPPLSGNRATKAELELGDFDHALDALESRGGGSFAALDLDLPNPTPRGADTSGSFGALEPIALPSAGASNTNQLPLSTLELAPHELLMGADIGPAPKSSLPALSSLAPMGHAPGSSLAPLGRAPGSSLAPLSDVGGEAFGELDLGVGQGSVGLPIDNIPSRRAAAPTPAQQQQQIEDAELLGEEPPQKKKAPGVASSLPGWAIPVGLVAAIGLGGTALGMFTQHGWFGVYLVEQMLPAAGDAARVKEEIDHAERQAKTDAYVDARRALVTLSDARNEAGLNRELLARSLLHESLYQLRFGEDGQSAQRAAAILARVLERGTDVPGLTLARAADAARRNDLPGAKALLAEVAPEGDRFRGLVAGEIALLEKQWDQAVQQFSLAAKAGEIARGQWGIARAYLAQGKASETEQAAKAVLAASPLHSPAQAQLAEAALLRGNVDEALSHARIAAGRTAIDGAKARPSKAERARAFSLEGRAEEKRDHPREAQASYELALAADPMSVPDLLGSARMAMRLGRPQEALSRFDSALNAKPSDQPGLDGKVPALEAGVGAIEAMLALGRAEEAVPRANVLLAKAPQDAEVQLWHGHVMEALERWEDAEGDFRGVIEKSPKVFDGYVALSQLLFKRSRPEEAARVLSQATSKVKDSAEVRRMLGNSELTRIHLPEAIKQFEAALKFDAKDPGALYGLVIAQRKSAQLDAADATLDRLQAADPLFPGLSLERGQLMETRGKYEEAAELYRKALATRPNDSDLKLRLGAALVTAGKIDEAEGVIEQVLKERPASAEAEHYLGRVLFARKETALAVQRFERSVNFDMRVAEYHMYLAWALLEQGDYGSAMESVQRAIKLDPNLGDARWILGRIQLRTGAVKDALVNLQAALRLKPGRVEALANIGDAHDELRDLSDAIKSYQEAVKRAPDNAEWWYRLGQLQLDKGQREPARASLAEAVLRGDKLTDPRPSWLAEAHRAYGDVLRESKRNNEATEHYKLFLEMAPLGHPDRNEIEQLVYQLRH